MFDNSTIFEPLFWIVMGVIYTIVAISARYWAKDLALQMNWWKWTLVIIWFVLLNITIAAGTTLIGENEQRAGLYFLGVFGTLFIVLGVGLWQLIKREK
jgi:hypothetical protein